MHFATVSTLFVGLAAAANHKIAVGKGGLKFKPNTTTAAVGDTIEFSFYPKEHSVVVGAFAEPCQAATTGGFFSGMVPVDKKTMKTEKQTFTVTVNDTNPIWFYCSASTHCQSGMVGVINPPADGAKTLAAYAEAANKSTAASQSPAAMFGGIMAVKAEKARNGTSTHHSKGPKASASATGSGDKASATSVVPTAGGARLVSEYGQVVGLVGGIALALAAF